MNLTVVDITPVPRAAVGDTVDLINGQGSEPVDAGEVAKLARTIHYELVSRIAEHVTRKLI
jgi:alanine racemase